MKTWFCSCHGRPCRHVSHETKIVSYLTGEHWFCDLSCLTTLMVAQQLVWIPLQVNKLKFESWRCKWTNWSTKAGTQTFCHWELVEAWCSGWGGGIHERLMESSNTKINLSPGWSEGGGRNSEKTAEDCWLDTEFKLLTLKWNCSHVDMTSRKRLRLEPCQFERCVQFFTW